MTGGGLPEERSATNAVLLMMCGRQCGNAAAASKLPTKQPTEASGTFLCRFCT